MKDDCSRPLTLLARIDGYSGYGLHAIQIARDLERMGVPIRIRPISQAEIEGCPIPEDIRRKFVTKPQKGEWELLLSTPNFMPTPGKKTIYFSMCESTRLPRASVDVLNKAELVIVPSEFCAVAFSASGVDRPIKIVPLGINTSTFHYRPMKMEGPCVFGTAGAGARKGINLIIEAFLLAFPNDPNVRLRIKTIPGELLQGYLGGALDHRIDVINQYLPEGELANWYASLTCFVSGSSGEGWGLMQQQAMAVGRPLISINFGGVREFFDETRGYVVPYTLKRNFFTGYVAEPNKNCLIQSMLWASAKRSDNQRLGYNAVNVSLWHTWENSNIKLLEAIQEARAKGEPVTEPVTQRVETGLIWRPKPWTPDRPKVSMKDVTLWACSWSNDLNNYSRVLRVLRYCSQRFDFEKILFFAYPELSIDGLSSTFNYTHIQIPKMDIESWNIFVNQTVPRHITTGYSMSVHEDGFPLAPELWREEFLAYDYIGAPWADGVVGNGGFNIESRQMMDAKLLLPPNYGPTSASDMFVCRSHRNFLESEHGIRFAPTDVAVEFSTEGTGQKFPSFGWHGRVADPAKYKLGWELIEESEKL